MSLTELLNTFLLLSIVFILIGLLNYLFNRVVTGPANRLVFSGSVFILLSVVLFVSSLRINYIDDPKTSYSIEALLLCVWFFTIGFLVNQLITYFFWNKFLRSKGIVVSKLVRDLFTLIILVITVAAIVHFVFNRSVIGIFAASGIMAIILGYSAQATLSDVFAGIGLNIAKQFNEGDLIRVLGMVNIDGTGIVKDINWRFVKFLTLDGNNLSIPNSVVAKQPIANLSKPYPTRGIKVSVPLPSNLSPERVKRILVSSANQSFKVSGYTPPKAVLLQMQEPNNLYQLTYYTKEADDAVVSDEILSIIWYQIRRKGLVSTEEKRVIPIEEIRQFLHQTDLFSILTDEEITTLSENSTFNDYGPPERILEQGQKNSSLFLIMRGSVDAYISATNQKIIKVATIKSGQYFGEMSLLTGDVCSATIIVNTETTLIEINHQAMSELFDKRPELVEKISEVVVRRKTQNTEARDALEKTTSKEQTTMISRMAERVRNFFKKSRNKKEEPKDNSDKPEDQKS